MGTPLLKKKSKSFDLIKKIKKYPIEIDLMELVILNPGPRCFGKSY
jgi:hypothetical protein